MSNVYTFGKLHQSRDFVQSANFTTHEKQFWCDWFDACITAQNFLKFIPKNISSKIWMFKINLRNEMSRLGFISMSKDFTGRHYPFVHYIKYENALLSGMNKHDIGQILSTEYDWFLLCLTKGYIVEKKLINNVTNQEKCLFYANYVVEFEKLIYASLNHEEHFSSNWLELNSLKSFNDVNRLTCTFYNRILG